jgi:hypothetical protein
MWDSKLKYFSALSISYFELSIRKFFKLFFMDKQEWHVFELFQSAHPYKYAGEKVDVQGVDIFKVSSDRNYAVCIQSIKYLSY